MATIRTGQGCPLMPGSYTVSIAFVSGDTKDAIDQFHQFSVLPCDILGTGKSRNCKKGLSVPAGRWEIPAEDAAVALNRSSA